ncbi:MAG: VWA domain-containing protein [Pirellulaceae bacterium]|nr:VWA domain-containing protein [Pirellulaceae bacterium]
MRSLNKPNPKPVDWSGNKKGQRCGAAAILVVSMMVVFVLTAAITVDYAHMQLVRSELRLATDAAAKAGAEALSRTQSTSQATNQAIEYASLNPVANRQVQVTPQDVIFGRVTQGQAGRWQFQAGATPFNSVRVNSRLDSPLFFGRLLGTQSFSPQESAVAGQKQLEVCLCLDRSGSMLFDMSGVDYAYPPNNPRLSNFTSWGTIWQNHLSPPHPTASRWAVLERAVQSFYTELNNISSPPYSCLVTWGSNYTMPIAPATVFPAARTDVELPRESNFIAQRQTISNAISQLGTQPMMGATNLSAGLDLAVARITGPQARPTSDKVVLLLTDGEWNEGRSPVLAAQDARARGVTVYVVSMLTGFQPVLQQVAQITGGQHYTTSNEAQLHQAFRDIASSLQVVLVE